LTETHEINDLLLGCPQTQKITSKLIINRHKKFWSIDPGKTPMWGKPVRERSSSYFNNFWKLHSAKIKPADI